MIKRIPAAAVLALGISCIMGEEHAQEHEHGPELDPSSPLLVSSRDRLEVCMQVDTNLRSGVDQLVASLRADLQTLSTTHPDWRAAGFDHSEVTIAVGCPGDVSATTAIDAKGAGGVVLGPTDGSEPSPYRTHVHVIEDARAAAVLGDQPFARAVAEVMLVDEHTVAEVSTAILVRKSALGSKEFRDFALTEGVGLRPLL